MVLLGRSNSLLSVNKKKVTLTSAKICVHVLTFAQCQEKFVLFRCIYFRLKKKRVKKKRSKNYFHIKNCHFLANEAIKNISRKAQLLSLRNVQRERKETGSSNK